MSQILCCDWLPERARWSFLAARDYPLPVRSASKVESMNNTIVSSLLSLFCWKMLLEVFRKFPTFVQGKEKGHFNHLEVVFFVTLNR